MYESGENYLETIYMLSNKNGKVRSIDIGRELNFSKPSVSRAIGLLKNDNYIVVDEGGYIHLTEKGKEKALAIYERHSVLTEFLTTFAKVERKIAEEDACRMEHIISEETFQGLKQTLEEMKG